MASGASLPQRKRNRLDGFSYGLGYAYSVTLCVRERRELFGLIEHDELLPSPAGMMIATIWQELPRRCPGVVLDVFSVMPDHFHGILGLIGKLRVDQPLADKPREQSLPEIIRQFKSRTTVEYTRGVKEAGWPSFNGRLWQRSYYDHVIRCDTDLETRREYIYNNAIAWQLEHPR
jgi:putative transposase